MDPLAELVGTSPAIVALRERVRHVMGLPQASGRLPPILLQGETGTGKGLLARLIHRAGTRAMGAFIDVNCAAIPETLLEAELFGFERGAFTDARQAKPGLFRLARGGTLFLDEVDLMSEALQAKLLTALEEHAVRPLGSTRSEPVDVWIIAASNTPLDAEVRARRFREDLYHRLAVLILTLPPLRERRDDIVLLAEHLLARDCAEYGLPPKQLSAEARAALRAHPWPGNVRELRNVIERALLIADASLITPESLGLPSMTPRDDAKSFSVERFASLEEEIAGITRQRLLDALHATGWNISRTARGLGLPRHRLRYLMEQHQLSRTSGRAGAAEGQTFEPKRAPMEPPVLFERTPSPAVRWEQRHVAFLRADLAARPTDGAQGTGPALALLADKAPAFRGIVLDLGSTTLIAAFGLEPVENAPTGAALAAVAMVKAFERAARDDPRVPGVAVAIHVASVKVGEINGTAQIDMRDRHAAWAALSALVPSTGPDTISVSSASVPFLDRRFDLIATGRSDRASGQIYGLTLRERAGFHLGARPLTRFVGRDHELAILVERLGQAAQGHGQVVGVVGEAGVGKSRFVYEVTRSERVRDWRIVHGSAVSSASATPWRPMADLLKRYFAVDDSDPAPQVRDKITTAMRDRGLESDMPALLALLDVLTDDPVWSALDPPQRRRRLIDGVKRLLMRESERRPLLVIIEDLHWADTETRSFLDTLVDRLPAAAVLLVVTCRPGAPHDWSGKSYFTQLRLDVLSPENAGHMLETLLGDNTTLRDLKDRLIVRTEGNPLFIEESVRALVEAGALTGQHGAYAFAAVPSLKIPASVHAILAERIDRLPADQKRLLQTAAIIGKDVPFTLLQAIAENTEEELRRRLARLQAAEFLYETSLFPDLEYTFKHALTHEVAYASLPEEIRRLTHARITEAIERVYADRPAEQVERLGHHAFRGQVWDKAVRYLQQAGAKAFERCANREAAGCLEQAIDALQHVPETRGALERAIDLRFDLRNPLTALGELEKLHDHLRQAERLAATLGDQRRVGRVANYLSHLFILTGEYTRGVDFGERALAVGKTLGDDLGIPAVANVLIGMARFSLGDYSGAVESLTRTTESLKGDLNRERFGLTLPPAVLARGWKAFCLGVLGRFAEAASCGEEAVQIAEAVAHAYGRAEAMLHAGHTYLLKGDLDGATRLLEQSVALCRATGIRLTFPMAAAWLGQARALAGRLPEGLALLAEAVDMADSMRHGINQSLFVGLLGEACLLAGRLDDAITHAAHALELSRRRNERGLEALTLRLLGEIHSHHDVLDPGEAEGSYRQAMALAAELGMRPLLAHCHFGLGKLYRRTGKQEQAEERLTTATAMYREMDMALWLEQAEAEMRELNASQEQ